MVITKTAKQKLRNYSRFLDYTLDIYRQALEFVNQVVYSHWAEIEPLKGRKRDNFVEHLIHSTSKNQALYKEFDERFYKFPTYFRRMVVSQAIGHVSSYMFQYQEWLSKPKGKKPMFNPKCNAFPVFYKYNTLKWIKNGKVALKLYNGSDWVWFVLPFEPIEIEKRFPQSEGWVRQSPMLVKKGKRWYLNFPFTKEVVLPKTDFSRPVLAVDLGLNHTAVCSVVYPDGTVLYREFISYKREKDRLDKLLGTIAKCHKQTVMISKGQSFAKRYWRKVVAITNEIAHQCSHRLVEIAITHNCQTIVFENLEKLKVPKNFYGARKLRKKLNYWLQGKIQRFTRYKANSKGIRFSRVLARGTSQYAFDGSGEVVRNGNKQIAVFPNGKKYNADLSASYNIGARYWIREIQNLKEFKSLGGNAQVADRDESSLSVARHQQTLASLISFWGWLSKTANALGVLYSSQSFSCKGKPPLSV